MQRKWKNSLPSIFIFGDHAMLDAASAVWHCFYFSKNILYYIYTR